MRNAEDRRGAYCKGPCDHGSGNKQQRGAVVLFGWSVERRVTVRSRQGRDGWCECCKRFFLFSAGRVPSRHGSRVFCSTSGVAAVLSRLRPFRRRGLGPGRPNLKAFLLLLLPPSRVGAAFLSAVSPRLLRWCWRRAPRLGPPHVLRPTYPGSASAWPAAPLQGRPLRLRPCLRATRQAAPLVPPLLEVREGSDSKPHLRPPLLRRACLRL